jgi:Holliday junction resolvasome RuvABC DNA-binding subunit
MASKIILELKDKDFVKSISDKNNKSEDFKENNIDIKIKNKVLESLINMGYPKQNIE